MIIKVNERKLLEDGFVKTEDGYYNNEDLYGFSNDELNTEIEVIRMEDAEEYIRNLFSDDEKLDLYCLDNEVAYSTDWVDVISE